MLVGGTGFRFSVQPDLIAACPWVSTPMLEKRVDGLCRLRVLVWEPAWVGVDVPEAEAGALDKGLPKGGHASEIVGRIQPEPGRQVDLEDEGANLSEHGGGTGRHVGHCRPLAALAVELQQPDGPPLMT